MSNFHEAAAEWHAEVEAEATQLLRSGAASCPSEALSMARRSIAERRRWAAVPPTISRDPRFPDLAKVIPDQGGPL